MSELDELYNECKTELCADSEDDGIFKFDFAFALNAFCNDWHGGMMSGLYALNSALSLEWQFSPNMEYYDEDNHDQKEIYEWLESKFEVSEL